MRDSESELPGITDHPDIDDDCVLHQGRDHKEQDCRIVSLNCQELLIILILMMIVYSIKEEITKARLRDSESELPGITDHPDIDDDCVLHQGRDHKEQDCGIVNLNCQELLIILILMMIIYSIKEEITKSKIAG